jgi:hypothetical protein
MPDAAVPVDVRDLARQLAEPRPMRRGSVSVRYMKCHKAGCACATRVEARHGPYYSVSRVVDGRTQSQWLSAEQAAQVRDHVAAGHQFRQRVDAYWHACEIWAEAQVRANAVSAEAAKKRASRRPSTRRSRPKSTRS